MGLFDGAATPASSPASPPPRTSPSYLQAPVVLVVDAPSQARSVAALVHGFATFDPRVRIGGVILNRVGTDRHEAILREALGRGRACRCSARSAGSSDLHTPSRHLGLVPAAERSAEALRTVRALGAVVEARVDLDAVLAARPQRPRPGRRALGPGRRGRRPVAGPAGGRRRRRAGLHLRLRRDRRAADRRRRRGGHRSTRCTTSALPEGTAALVVGGGFPEVHAARCGERRLRTAVADARRPRRRRSPPSAPGCSTCRASWTASRCAACCRRRRR